MEHTSSFNYVDLAVLGILVLSGIVAFMRGLVREVFALGAWVGASFASAYFYPIAKPWVHTHIKSEMAADAATAAGLFCLALVILIPLGNLFSGMVKGRTLTAIDRSLGFVFGLARGVLVVSLLYLVMIWMWPEKDKLPEWLAEAKTRPLLAYGADTVKEMFPEEERKKVEAELKRSQDSAKDADNAAQILEKMSSPKPAAEAQDKDKGKTQAYGTDDRGKLNQLIGEKGTKP